MLLNCKKKCIVFNYVVEFITIIQICTKLGQPNTAFQMYVALVCFRAAITICVALANF